MPAKAPLTPPSSSYTCPSTPTEIDRRTDSFPRRARELFPRPPYVGSQQNRTARRQRLPPAVSRPSPGPSPARPPRRTRPRQPTTVPHPLNCYLLPALVVRNSLSLAACFAVMPGTAAWNSRAELPQIVCESINTPRNAKERKESVTNGAPRSDTGRAGGGGE